MTQKPHSPLVLTLEQVRIMATVETIKRQALLAARKAKEE